MTSPHQNFLSKAFQNLRLFDISTRIYQSTLSIISIPWLDSKCYLSCWLPDFRYYYLLWGVSVSGIRWCLLVGCRLSSADNGLSGVAVIGCWSFMVIECCFSGVGCCLSVLAVDNFSHWPCPPLILNEVTPALWVQKITVRRAWIQKG